MLHKNRLSSLLCGCFPENYNHFCQSNHNACGGTTVRGIHIPLTNKQPVLSVESRSNEQQTPCRYNPFCLHCKKKFNSDTLFGASEALSHDHPTKNKPFFQYEGWIPHALPFPTLRQNLIISRANDQRPYPFSAPRVRRGLILSQKFLKDPSVTHCHTWWVQRLHGSTTFSNENKVSIYHRLSKNTSAGVCVGFGKPVWKSKT